MSIFIGRKKEIADAVAELTQVDEGVVWDIVGVHGIGKTEFLRQVRADAEGLAQRPEIINLDLAELVKDVGRLVAEGPQPSAAVLWQTFVQSRDLMVEWADGFIEKLRAEEFHGFLLACDKISKKADEFLREHELRPGTREDQPESVVEQGVSTTIRDFQASLDKEYRKAWDTFTARRRVLIILDNFEVVAATEFGRWLVRLALQLPRTLTLLARVSSGVTSAPDHDRLHRLELPPFTVDEVAEYLSERLHGEQLHPGLAKVVYRYTDGHPGGVTLAATLIREKGSGIDDRSLARILDRLPDDPEKRWGKIVHLIVEAVAAPQLRKAVDAASVTVSFDASLLAALLQTDNAGDAVRALEEHRLTQSAPDARGPNYYRLLEFIRLSLAEDLRLTDPPRWTQLHERAAAYYMGILSMEETPEGESYGQWLRYESPEWQANKQAWLYHSGRMEKRRELTRARFVLVFLEAFWWWGCYHEFDFNKRLVDDWERAATTWGGNPKATEQDQQLADALRFLLVNYPRGHEKPSDKWDTMRSSLHRVQHLCGLTDGKPLPDDPEERRQMTKARGMTKVFLAHTRRFRNPADPEASRYYAQALKIFEKVSDEWIVAWLLFETADLALEREQPDEAVALLAKSAALVIESTLGEGEHDADEDADEDAVLDADETSGTWDFELLANLHRARADAHYARGEIAEAAVEYGRSVTDAYWFQGMPQRPDAYTYQFYEEITGRTTQRIRALAAQDPDAALAFANAVRGELGSAAPAADLEAALRAGQDADLRAALFPRGPDPATELGEDSSPFMDEWLVFWEDRADPAQRAAVLAEPELAGVVSPSTPDAAG